MTLVVLNWVFMRDSGLLHQIVQDRMSLLIVKANFIRLRGGRGLLIFVE